MSTTVKYVPEGWASTRISMGQVWEGGLPINQTLQQFNNGQYANSLDGYFTYFGSGNAADTRSSLLPASTLTSGKIPGLVSDVSGMGGANPVLVVYSNDFSTQEDNRTNQDVVGTIVSTQTTTRLVDGIEKTVYTNTYDTTIPITQFANLALQAGAFAKVNQENGSVGSILFNPDGIGAMAKNFIYNNYSPNSDLASEPGKAILLTDYSPAGSSSIYSKTLVDYEAILTAAVDQVWALRTDPSYSTALYFPSEKPDPARVTNGVLPIQFAGDITDYLAAQAWMLDQFGGDHVTLSTVTNLWAGPWAGGQSMLTATSAQVDEFAQTAVNAYKSLGWSKANPYLDFITFDKYERDETSGQVTAGTYGAYAFTETAWNNAMHFYNAVAAGVMPADKLAIMLWQIPASGLPTTDPSDAAMLSQGWNGDTSIASLDVPHFGVTQSYFFGSANLAANGIATEVSNITFTDPYGKSIVYGQRLTADSTWSPATGLIDSSNGDQADSLDHVFAILWGGGNTSAPVSYKSSQWTGVGGTDVAESFNVKNAQGTAVLTILDNISDYKQARLDGTSIIDGSAARDVLVLSSARSDYTITALRDSALGQSFSITDAIASRNGQFEVHDYERLCFHDHVMVDLAGLQAQASNAVALDVDESAGDLYRLYYTTLGRAPDELGFGSWLYEMDNDGWTLENVTARLLHSEEFISNHGSLLSFWQNQDRAGLLEILYEQSFGRAPDAAGLEYWMEKTTQDNFGEVAIAFATSTESKLLHDPAVANGIAYLSLDGAPLFENGALVMVL